MPQICSLGEGELVMDGRVRTCVDAQLGAFSKSWVFDTARQKVLPRAGSGIYVPLGMNVLSIYVRGLACVVSLCLEQEVWYALVSCKYVVTNQKH